MITNDEKVLLDGFSALTGNGTSSGYQETRIGFVPPLDHVGSITRKFTFTKDPWSISSAGGVLLCSLNTIILNVVKVFNPNNTTESYLTLSWKAEHFYRGRYDEPQLGIKLMADDGATLVALSLGRFPSVCGQNPIFQSFQHDFPATFFDRVVAGAYSISAATWDPC